MRPTVDVPAPTPCAFMAELVDLLGEPPAGRAGSSESAFAGRLDRLRAEARRRGAPEATVEAIDSARALLQLAEAPVVFVMRSGAVH